MVRGPGKEVETAVVTENLVALLDYLRHRGEDDNVVEAFIGVAAQGGDGVLNCAGIDVVELHPLARRFLSRNETPRPLQAFLVNVADYEEPRLTISMNSVIHRSKPHGPGAGEHR